MILDLKIQQLLVHMYVNNQLFQLMLLSIIEIQILHPFLS